MNLSIFFTTIILAIFYFFNTRLRLREFSLYLSLVIFIYMILLWLFFNPYEQTYQFNIDIKELSLNLSFGIDGLSLFFMFLTSFLFPICILFNWNNTNFIKNEFYIIILSMETLLLVLFTTQNMLLFYICFEIILIPLFILIGINNYRVRRIHAAFMLFLYTLFGSLFMLFTILYLYSISGSLDFHMLYNIKLDFNIEKLLWILLFVSFAIKVPLFPFHIWLPEAHVEAPTEGSILLAGIILKLAVYGYLRILIPIFYQATIYYLPLVFLISVISGLYASFSTIRQTDIKRIIAYSSIAHMSIGVIGLFTLKPIGILGSLLVMFSHGIVSGGLFLMVGMLYDRFKTKTVFYYNGLVQFMPLIASFFLILILGNISFPGTSSFIGETLIIIDIVSTHLGTMSFIFIILFLCTLYSLFLYNKIFFGIPSINKQYIAFDITRREFHLIVPFIIFVLWIGFYPAPFITLIESTIYLISFNQ